MNSVGLCFQEQFLMPNISYQFIPLPPEGSVATSLLTGKPAPSPLFNTGPSDGFSCHVNPSRLIAAHKDREKSEAAWGHTILMVNCHSWKHIKLKKYRRPINLCLICLLYGNQCISRRKLLWTKLQLPCSTSTLVFVSQNWQIKTIKDLLFVLFFTPTSKTSFILTASPAFIWKSFIKFCGEPVID